MKIWRSASHRNVTDTVSLLIYLYDIDCDQSDSLLVTIRYFLLRPIMQTVTEHSSPRKSSQNNSFNIVESNESRSIILSKSQFCSNSNDGYSRHRGEV